MSIGNDLKNNLLTLSCFGKIGPRGLEKIWSSVENVNLKGITEVRLTKAGITPEIASQLIKFIEKFDVDAELEKLQKYHVNIVTRLDDQYPALLNEISDPPYLLYVYGNLDYLQSPTLAIVGSRKHTHYGVEVIDRVVPELAERGITVVSGLALGIDTLAHKTTLSNNGKTVAVIGCGLDIIYPASNVNLAKEIVRSGGAIISEYPLGTPPLKQHFPARNRIISGLSLGTLVVECDIESGAMITAHHTLDQNREVLAVPGLITSPLSAGPNKLIQMGAKTVTSGKDVLEGLGLFWDEVPVSKILPDVKLKPDEDAIYQLLSHEPLHIDVIVEQSKMEMAQVNAALLFLEIKGMVRNIGAAKYIKR